MLQEGSDIQDHLMLTLDEEKQQVSWALEASITESETMLSHPPAVPIEGQEMFTQTDKGIVFGASLALAIV